LFGIYLGLNIPSTAYVARKIVQGVQWSLKSLEKGKSS